MSRLTNLDSAVGKKLDKAVVCLSRNNIAQIFASGKCPQDTVQGVAPQEMLVADAKPVISHIQENKPYLISCT